MLWILENNWMTVTLEVFFVIKSRERCNCLTIPKEVIKFRERERDLCNG